MESIVFILPAPHHTIRLLYSLNTLMTLCSRDGHDSCPCLSSTSMAGAQYDGAELVPGQLPSARSIRRTIYEMKQPTSLLLPSKNADYDYQFIPSACKKFEQENPGSIAVCDTNTSVMEEYFTMLDNDGSDYISQTKLMNTLLGKNGYSESDLKNIILDMNLDSPDSPISKNPFLSHFTGKVRRVAVIFRP